jgi:LysR family transcriptional regulator, regulator of abg operon
MDRRLQALVATAETGSVSKAAIKLNLTQSALSKVLRKLEEEFGATLLERQARGVSLTAAGSVLVRRAERAALELAHAREEISALKQHTPKLLKIGAGPIYLLDWIRYPIREIAARYPDLAFEILSLDAGEALAKLLKGELDAFLGYVDLDAINENMDCVSIDRVSAFVFATAPQAAEGSSTTQTAVQPWVNYRQAVRTNERVHDYWLRHFGVAPNVRFVSSSMSAALTLAADNGCWICLPSPLASVAARHGLQRVAHVPSLWEFNTGCVVRRSSLGYDSIREFLDIIVRKVRDGRS